MKPEVGQRWRYRKAFVAEIVGKSKELHMLYKIIQKLEEASVSDCVDKQYSSIYLIHDREPLHPSWVYLAGQEAP